VLPSFATIGMPQEPATAREPHTRPLDLLTEAITVALLAGSVT